MLYCQQYNKMPDKSTKKILFVITKSVWGGAQKYVFDLATNLPKDLFEPVIAGGGKGIMAEKIISAGLPYLEIKRLQRDIKFWKEIVSFFEILKLLFCPLFLVLRLCCQTESLSKQISRHLSSP